MLRIRIEDKTYHSADGPPRRIFQRFSLDIPDGQVCAIAGPSGIGKTTLLAIVSGLDGDFTGQVSDHGGPIGFVFQEPRLLPWLTARRNVELAIPGREGEAERWLAAVGLAGHGAVYPERLSLGMARRVSLARALAVRPKLLLLDEPFASLDPETASAMRDLLDAQLRQTGATTLIVTHELRLAATLADRTVTLAGQPAGIARDMPTTATRTGTAARAGDRPAGLPEHLH